MDRFTMAVVQMDSQSDREANLEKAGKFVAEAVRRGANFVSFPENVNYIGTAEGKKASAEPLPGPTSELFSGLAARHGVWIHCGSYAEKIPGEDMVYNLSIVVDPAGKVVARYRKIHLYDVDIVNGPSVKESSAVVPGKEIETFESDFGRMGLTVCYDMRFPELYRILALRGARLIFVPANYTLFTGKDHWEVVLRARAIENQCFIAAAGQWGVKPAFQAYGRSMIIDPWGTVIAQAADGEGLCMAEIDMTRVDAVRKQLPSLPNRRPEAYDWK